MKKQFVIAIILSFIVLYSGLVFLLSNTYKSQNKHLKNDRYSQDISHLNFTEYSFEFQNFIRIHIQAKSDKDFDQAVKLRVRDRIVSYLRKILVNCDTKDEALSIISSQISQIKAIADESISMCGANYSSDTRISRETFPQRIYGEKVFPKGVYDSLIITLGDGKGANWWCVAYPPLCFIGGVENPDAPDKITYNSLFIEWIQKLQQKDDCEQ